MAFLYITEFATVPYAGMQGGIGNAMLPLALVPPEAEQRIAVGGTSTQSAAFNSLTKYVRLHTDVGCSVAWGISPVATDEKMRMGAGSTEYLGVLPGYKIAVIANT